MVGRGNKKILVVDDDQDILELLKYNLEKDGYDVLTHSESTDVVSIAHQFLPDLIILDIMLPDQNGIELCRQLRSEDWFKNTYIFFLTARSEYYYQDAAFITGGDDYIEKIVGLKALTKRVSAVLKRNFVIRKSKALLRAGNLLMNRKNFSVHINGSEIKLSKPEFEVLFFFAQNPSRIISLENLTQSLWGSETYAADAHVEVYIQNLQRKLGHGIIRQKKDHLYLFNTV
jgi:two-component system, OmpR family, alkaline phosphatase synthesis response regulator PhoP